MVDENNKYTKMQQEHYDIVSTHWSPTNRDPVVGSFDRHNSWPMYEILFENLKTQDMIGLDFGCGPGRNIAKYGSRFLRLDGVDMAAHNLVNAQLWAEQHGVNGSVFYQNNGVDLRDIPSDEYHLVMSTICLQHICIHEIRYNIFKEFFRVLKPGGVITIQMGFGPGHRGAVDYYENFYDAIGTNTDHDVKIERATDLEKDLNEIGFNNFNYALTPTGPGDGHPNWIFFKAYKPHGEPR